MREEDLFELRIRLKILESELHDLMREREEKDKACKGQNTEIVRMRKELLIPC